MRCLKALALLLMFSGVLLQRDSSVYKEVIDQNSSQLVSLGGFFSVRENNEEKCGRLFLSSVEELEAMVFTIGAINSDDSILPGVNLTYSIHSTCQIANFALEGAIELNSRSCGDGGGGGGGGGDGSSRLAISGVVGAVRSAVSGPLASLLRLFQIPQISHASTAAFLSDKTTYDYFFRTISSDALQARAMADLISHYEWNYIFALHSDDSYGTSGINSLVDSLALLNKTSRCLAVMEALPTGSTDAEVFKRVAEKMSREWVRNASVAVLFGHENEALEMLKALTVVGVLNDITWLASDAWALALELHGRRELFSTARGMLGFVPVHGDVLEFNTYFAGLNPSNSAANPWFAEYWEDVFNCSLESTVNNSRVPCDMENTTLSEKKISSFVPFTINAVNAFAYAIDRMITDHCPGVNICDNITNTLGDALNGEMLRDYLFNVSFPSSSSNSKLMFDSDGDIQGSYDIVNLQRMENDQYSFQTIGTWDGVNLLQLTQPIQWKSGGEDPPQSVCSLPCEAGQQPHLVANQQHCCWECLACTGENYVSSGERCYQCPERHMSNDNQSHCVEIPVTYFSWTSPWAIVILILTCLGIILTVIVALFFIVFRNNKVIKAASWELSAILLSGILLSYVVPVVFLLRPSPALCGVRRFAIGFCFAISYSALLVRSNRIHRIFSQATKSTRPVRFIGRGSQVVFTGLLVTVQVLIAVIWLVVERPSVETEQVDSHTVELRCGESPYFGLSVTLIYNLFLLILSTYLAFLTRRVPADFNEAKFINLTVYSLCVIWLAFIPTYFISIKFGTVFNTFTLLLAVILSASATLGCLMVPKIVLVLRNKKGRANTTSKPVSEGTSKAVISMNSSVF